MKAFVISYVMNKKDESDRCVMEKLNEYPNWQVLPSTWIVGSRQEGHVIANNLVACFDDGNGGKGKFLINELDQNAKTFGYKRKDFPDWLRDITNLVS